MFDVKIDWGDLFRECMDQTLIDYRERVTGEGQPIATTHTMDHSLGDIFRVQLRSVAAVVYIAIRAGALFYHFAPWGVTYRMKDVEGVPYDVIGVLVKDALKYGMLAWWYKSRDVPLFQFYTQEHDKTIADIHGKITGSYALRPYRLY